MYNAFLNKTFVLCVLWRQTFEPEIHERHHLLHGALAEVLDCAPVLRLVQADHILVLDEEQRIREVQDRSTHQVAALVRVAAVVAAVRCGNVNILLLARSFPWPRHWTESLAGTQTVPAL